MEGAYALAYHHACELVKMDSAVEHKEFLLFFYDVSERLLCKEEAYLLAQEILKEKPDSLVANNLLKRG